MLHQRCIQLVEQWEMQLSIWQMRQGWHRDVKMPELVESGQGWRNPHHYHITVTDPMMLFSSKHTEPDRRSS
jgi:hypothetical protein